jgi:isoquinoline 1-oxidoreductase subunit beta
MKPLHNPLEPSILKKVDRRSFLKISGISATGIIIGMQIGCSPSKKKDSGIPFSPNVYLTVNSDGTVTIVAHRSEMGTGIRTGLPLIVADELEADWSKVKVVQAIGDEARYGNQNTDGSFSVRMFFEPMRKAGATARMMLEQAAANEWGVPVGECKAKNGEVAHQGSGKKLGFGELTEAASKLEMPAEEKITLKKRSEWKFIGKSTPIVDIEDIISGKGGFGLDKKVAGMKYATVLRCPVAGGKVKTFNADKAMQVAGVQKVFEMPFTAFPGGINAPLGGLLVVADNTWAAIKGRDVLEVEWDFGPNAKYSTADYFKDMLGRVTTKGQVHREEGSVETSFKNAAKTIDSTYLIPHLSHAPMEPPCAVAHFKDGKCEVWAPTQNPQGANDALAEALKIDKANVTVNVTLLGGGFGRKSKPDFIVEAALASQMSGFPVKIVWTREDDIQHDFFHACSVQRIKVALDNNKKVTGWEHHSVFPPIGGTYSPDATGPSFDELQLGMVDMPFDIPNISCQSHEAKAMTRIGWLRSVSNIQHAFAIGSMVDEIATVRQMDPVENLLDLIGSDREIPFDKLMEGFGNYGEPVEKFPMKTARLKNVVKLAAEKSGWGKELPKGHGMGICAHRSFLTYVACVVHVAVDEGGKLTIPEVHFAVDCGIVVNQNSVKNQFEGGGTFASSLALKGGIAFKNGQTIAKNFDQFEVARMQDTAKEIFVHLVESDEKPTGVGEPPVPPFAPALANAVFAATGKRSKELPIKMS